MTNQNQNIPYAVLATQFGGLTYCATKIMEQHVDKPMAETCAIMATEIFDGDVGKARQYYRRMVAEKRAPGIVVQEKRGRKFGSSTFVFDPEKAAAKALAQAGYVKIAPTPEPVATVSAETVASVVAGLPETLDDLANADPAALAEIVKSSDRTPAKAKAKGGKKPKSGPAMREIEKAAADGEPVSIVSMIDAIKADREAA